MDEKTAEFLNKFAERKHTREEHIEFLNWLKTIPEEEAARLLDLYPHILEETVAEPLPHKEVVENIEASLDVMERSSVRGIVSWSRAYQVAAVAAFLAGIVTLAIYFYVYPTHEKKQLALDHQVPASSKPPVPGGNKALLTLSDGHVIVLDSADNGLLATQAGSRIRKTANGQLVYDASAPNKSTMPTAFNTVSTPRGGQYQLTLPDGSRVWLNAASSLKFPAVFDGDKRMVELTGEAYFEVAKNKKMPFIVTSLRQTVEVLGTHFNINAYPDDEAIQTTLVEGSVKVSVNNSDQSDMLKPGQQATVAKRLTVAEVDAQQAIDWKNGFFSFSHEHINTIMPKIARWYDVDVEYRGMITQEGFVGSISRFEEVSEVLKMLELTGSVHFKVEGRKIVVMP